jgi:membrane fusion protein, adhesin transport system
MDQPSSDQLPSAPVPFRGTVQSLALDHARDSRAGMVLVLVAVLAWSIWSTLARIPIYATSDRARLESPQSTYRIAPAVDGRIRRADLQLGQTVQKGQILVELDSAAPRNALDEGTARVDALRQDVAALDRQIEAAGRAVDADRARQQLAIREAAAAADEGAAQLELARRQSSDLAKLRAAGLVADATAVAAAQEAKARLARFNTLDLARQQRESARLAADAEAQARLTTLQAQRLHAQGNVALAERAIAQLHHDIDLRRIVAPVSGRIGALQNVHAGSFVSAGADLGAVVPDESLRIAADLPPELMTRVRAGQAARFRFEGVATLTHGSLAAVVTQIGSDVRNGTFEVILAPAVQATAAVPLMHGARGSIDIEIERLSPLNLLLRRAGELTEPRRPRQP